MSLLFPQFPTEGDFHTDQGKTYRWTGDRWAIVAEAASPMNPIAVFGSGVQASVNTDIVWELLTNQGISFGNSFPNGSITLGPGEYIIEQHVPVSLTSNISSSETASSTMFVDGVVVAAFGYRSQTRGAGGVGFSRAIITVPDGQQKVVSSQWDRNNSNWNNSQYGAANTGVNTNRMKITQIAGYSFTSSITNPKVFHDPTEAASWRIGADNTLECWGINRAGVGSSVVITFPKVFARPPIITGSGTAGSVTAVLTPADLASTTEVTVNVRRGDTNGAVNTDWCWYALGEWDGVS